MDSAVACLVLVMVGCAGSGIAGVDPGGAPDVSPGDEGQESEVSDGRDVDHDQGTDFRADQGESEVGNDSEAGRLDSDLAGDIEDVDTPPAPLSLVVVSPDRGGASTSTEVVIEGTGFVPGMTATLGAFSVTGLVVESDTRARAVFGPVALADRGTRDLEVVRGDDIVVLGDAFTFQFDQDPIVFVHGFMGGGEKDFGVMVERFRDLGYPDGYLNAISYNDDTGSSIAHARDELTPYVDEVLARTGASKVDIVAHSMGGLSSTMLWWAGAREMCPAYAGRVNEVQWTLNGDPDLDDVDETPFGVEDGGPIRYRAIHSDGDLVILPYESSCLNQTKRFDCSDPVNVRVKGIGHNDVPKDEGVFRMVAEFLMVRGAQMDEALKTSRTPPRMQDPAPVWDATYCSGLPAR
jgi:triacylglycerol lipase